MTGYPYVQSISQMISSQNYTHKHSFDYWLSQLGEKQRNQLSKKWVTQIYCANLILIYCGTWHL